MSINKRPRLNFYRSPEDSARIRFLWRYYIKKAVQANRRKRFINDWYAPPRAVYGIRGLVRTGGGPGYRLGLHRWGISSMKYQPLG